MQNKKTAMLSSVSLAALALSGCGATTPTVVQEQTPVKTETPTPAPVVTETPVVVTSSASVTVTSSVVAPTPAPAPTPAAHTYKDGTYSTVGTYNSPAGNEEIGVTITLKNDIITAVSVEPKATAMKSIRMQQDFAANYKTLVVGKNIASVNLGKVSGASLTPLGFNDAVAKIEAQAK